MDRPSRCAASGGPAAVSRRRKRDAGRLRAARPTSMSWELRSGQTRCSIVVSISTCHAEDPGSIPGGGVCSDASFIGFRRALGNFCLQHTIFRHRRPGCNRVILIIRNRELEAAIPFVVMKLHSAFLRNENGCEFHVSERVPLPFGAKLAKRPLRATIGCIHVA